MPLLKRITKHKNDKGCRVFFRAIKKYGLENFKKIQFSCPEEDLDWIESFLIKEFKSQVPNGYNLESGGHKNKHVHKKTRQKISKQIKEYFKLHPQEGKRRLKLRYKNPEEKKKTGERTKKYWEENPEQKIINSQQKVEYWENNPILKKELSKKMIGNQFASGKIYTKKEKKEQSERMKLWWQKRKGIKGE